jgi:KTSC domain-containing protein
MERVPVNSDVIASIGYESGTNTMEVEFKTGRIYHFFLITPGVHSALMCSESIGRYFNAEIRNRFPHREVSERA